MRCCNCNCDCGLSVLKVRLQTCFGNFDTLQYLAVILIYVQIACALIGSIGASYNGVLIINFAICLFALIAIESNSQSLCRTYAFLLFCDILLDIAWLLLFTLDIWNMSTGKFGLFFLVSVKLTLAMQIMGFFVRLSSSFLWIQIYRLGVSHVEAAPPRDTDSDVRSGFLSPSPTVMHRNVPVNNAGLGGSSRVNPPHYSPLFEDNQDNRDFSWAQNSTPSDTVSTSSAEREPSQLKPFLQRFFSPISEEDEEGGRPRTF